MDNGERSAAMRRAVPLGGHLGRRLFYDPQSGDEFPVGVAAGRAERDARIARWISPPPRLRRSAYGCRTCLPASKRSRRRG